MSNAVISFFQGLGLSDDLVVFIVSMLPIIELRGAIPLGFVMGMNPWELLALTVIGNILPIPFIILCARHIVNFFLRTKLLRPLGNWLEAKVRKNSHRVAKYKFWGLCLFVAIPLPGTGGWTGALLAALMDLRIKSALPSIVLGVLIAGLIMIFGSSIVSFVIGLF
ncbi:MAG: small multi-drug export protein [Ruminococcaceae bacterium]|nr:small multi-drug export protein [Oscillospiraceae bacterium]